MSHSDARYEAGLVALDEIDGPAGREVVMSLEPVAPDLARFIVEFGFCDVYGGPAMDRRGREIATIAVLTVLGGCEPQLAIHVGAGLNVGLSPKEIIETMTHTCFYAGFPRAINAVRVAERVFAERGVEVSAAAPSGVVRELITALADKDLEKALAAFHADAELVVPGDPKVLRWAGTRKGRDGIAEFFELAATVAGPSNWDIRLTVPAGENVFVLGRCPLPAYSGGDEVADDFILHFVVRDGLVVRCRVHLDSFATAGATPD